jgi:hypothetical protein
LLLFISPSTETKGPVPYYKKQAQNNFVVYYICFEDTFSLPDLLKWVILKPCASKWPSEKRTFLQSSADKCL